MCVSAFICFGHHVGHHSCLLFNFLDHIALWIVVVAFAFALFMPAFIISTTAGKQELEKGQARDVGETHVYIYIYIHIYSTISNQRNYGVNCQYLIQVTQWTTVKFS